MVKECENFTALLTDVSKGFGNLIHGLVTAKLDPYGF